MFQATRRRLAFWYTAVTAVLLLIFATGFYFYVRSTLIERVDDTLNHVVEVVERSLIIESLPNGKFSVNVEASFPNNANSVEDDRIDLEWFSPTGELRWSTLSEPLNIPLTGPNHTGETVRLSTDRLLRQVTERVQIGRQVLGYLRVSHPWFEVAKPTHLLMVDLILGTVITLISVAAIGWLLSGLAIKPIRESYQRLKQFTSDASHELRNPIAMIQTNVQVALADPDLDIHLQQQQMKVIERLTRRLGRLVDDLLFLARQDSNIVQPNLVAVHLDALLMELIEEQHLIASEKAIALSLKIVAFENNKRLAIKSNQDKGLEPIGEDDIFIVQGDWDQLARLFTNLVSNALQYTPNQGKVEVQLHRISRHGTPHLQVKVIDTGIGIPESALPHIFDRFYRIDPARTHDSGRSPVKGSGLGLAIAQAIVQNHQGQILVDSVVHQGTTFTVILPSLKSENAD